MQSLFRINHIIHIEAADLLLFQCPANAMDHVFVFSAIRIGLILAVMNLGFLLLLYMIDALIVLMEQALSQVRAEQPACAPDAEAQTGAADQSAVPGNHSGKEAPHT